ncbi:Transposable element Tcb1 transposase, partial [Stegodyphus mimosarum]
MVWGAISLVSRTPLAVIRGTLTVQRYVDDILSPVLLPFLLQYPDLIFREDNARPHTARAAMSCLTAYQTLPCPARSPDLSPIEPLWDMMGRRLHLPGNVVDLVRQLEKIWHEIPQKTIRELYHSMPRRVDPG